MGTFLRNSLPYTEGVFIDSSNSKYYKKRELILSNLNRPPSLLSRKFHSTLREVEILQYLRDDLEEFGICVLDTCSPLTTDVFMALGYHLGVPISEKSEEVQCFVERGIVLNIKPVKQDSRDVRFQPFSNTELSLHTEGSLAQPQDRPQLLLFQCIIPPPPNSGGYTLVIPVSDITSRLSQKAQRVLKRTCYKGRSLTDPIVWELEQKHCLSLTFRDFKEIPLEWRYWKENTGEDFSNIVEESIEELLFAIYTSHVFSISWRKGTILAFDNRLFMHGRSLLESPKAERHLQRIRLKPKA